MKTFLGVLSTLLLLVIVYMFFTNKYDSGAGNGSVVSDTIYINHIDTFIKEKLKPYAVYVDRVVTDTLLSVDSIPVEVNIPISINKFRDTIISKSDTAIISSTISGHHVNYDTLNVIFKLSNRIVNNTVTIKPRNKKFHIGPYVGVSISGNQIQSNVGIGISYSFWSF